MEREHISTTPTMIGSYTLLKRIGAGGMATVYLAQHPEANAPVALKVVHLGGQPNAHTRFEREASALMRLDHPNIVQMLDYGVDDEGFGYIAMKYLDGGSLKQHMRERHGSGQPFTIAGVLEVGRQIGAALQLAHAHKLIHRDIKPANILIASQQGLTQYVLSDFGLVLDQQATRLTWNEPGMGTPDYMAPEQITPHCTVDARADVYALGMVMYEMLAGRAPFKATEPLTTLYKHVHEDAQDIRRLRPDVPAPVAEIIMRAIARNPRQRFQQAKQLVSGIQPLLATPSGKPKPAVPIFASAFSAASMVIALVVSIVAISGEPVRTQARNWLADNTQRIGLYAADPTATPWPAPTLTLRPSPLPTRIPAPSLTPSPQVLLRFSVDEDAQHQRLDVLLGKPFTMEWQTLRVTTATLQLKPDKAVSPCPAGKLVGIVAKGATKQPLALVLPSGRMTMRFIAPGRYVLLLQLTHDNGNQRTLEREIRVGCGEAAR